MASILGGTWIYAVPSSAGFGGAVFSNQFAIPGGVRSENVLRNPHYKSAYSVQVGYDFPCSANNLEVEYTHLFNTKKNVNTNQDNLVSFTGYAFVDGTIPIAPGEPLAAVERARLKFDQVDVTGGHRFITCSGCLQLHPFIGVRYSDLRITIPFNTQLAGIAFNEGIFKTKFWGVGPLAGMDFFYGICKGLGIVGRADSSILMGSAKFFSSITTLGFVQEFASPNQDRAVCTFGGRLGLAYNYFFCNRSRVKLEVGYQANVYLDPLDILVGTVSPPTDQKISNIEALNFSYTGPYINLTWHL